MYDLEVCVVFLQGIMMLVGLTGKPTVDACLVQETTPCMMCVLLQMVSKLPCGFR